MLRIQGSENIIATLDADNQYIVFTAQSIDADSEATFELSASVEDVVSTATIAVKAKDLVTQEFSFQSPQLSLQMQEGGKLSIPILSEYDSAQKVTYRINSIQNSAFTAYLTEPSDTLATNAANLSGLIFNASKQSQSKQSVKTQTRYVEVFAPSIIGTQSDSIEVIAYIDDNQYRQQVLIEAQQDDFPEVTLAAQSKVVEFEQGQSYFLPITLNGASTFNVEALTGSDAISVAKQAQGLVFTSLATTKNETTVYSLSATNGNETKYIDISVTALTQSPEVLLIDLPQTSVVLAGNTTFRLPINIEHNKAQNYNVDLEQVSGSNLVSAQYINQAISITTQAANTSESAVFNVIVTAGELTQTQQITVNVATNNSVLAINAALNEVALGSNSRTTIPFLITGNSPAIWLEVDKPEVLAAFVGNGQIILQGLIANADSNAVVTLYANENGNLVSDTINVRVGNDTPYSIDVDMPASMVELVQGQPSTLTFEYTQVGNRVVETSIVAVEENNELSAKINNNEITLLAPTISANAINTYELVLQAGDYIKRVPFTAVLKIAEAPMVNMSLSQTDLSFLFGSQASTVFSINSNSAGSPSITFDKTGSDAISAKLVNNTIVFSSIASDTSGEATYRLTANIGGASVSQTINVQMLAQAPEVVFNLASYTMQENASAEVPFEMTYGGTDTPNISVSDISNAALSAVIEENILKLSSTDVPDDTSVTVTLKIDTAFSSEIRLIEVNVQDSPRITLTSAQTQITFDETGSASIPFTASHNKGRPISYSLAQTAGSVKVSANIINSEIVFTSANINENTQASFRLVAVEGELSQALDFVVNVQAVVGELAFSLNQTSIAFTETEQALVGFVASYSQDDVVNMSIQRVSGSDQINAFIDGSNIVLTSADILSVDATAVFEVTASVDGISQTISLNAKALVELGEIALTLDNSQVNLSEASTQALGFSASHSLNKAMTYSISLQSGSSAIAASMINNAVSITVDDVQEDVWATFVLRATDGEISQQQTFTVNVQDTTVYVDLSVANSSVEVAENETISLPLDVSLTNETGSEEVIFTVEKTGFNSDKITTSITNKVLSITAQNMQRAASVQLTIAASVGQQISSIVVNVDVINTSALLLQEKYAAFVNNQVYVAEAGIELAEFYANTAILSEGFDEQQSQEMLLQYQADSDAIADAANSSSGLVFYQALSDYENGQLDEDDLEAAFASHLSELDYLHKQTINTLNTAANVSNDYLPNLVVGEYQLIYNGNYSAFVENLGMGALNENDFSFTGNFAFLARYISINGLRQACEPSE